MIFENVNYSSYPFFKMPSLYTENFSRIRQVKENIFGTKKATSKYSKLFLSFLGLDWKYIM